MSSKSASEPLAGRLLPRLVIMHSSAETHPGRAPLCAGLPHDTIHWCLGAKVQRPAPSKILPAGLVHKLWVGFSIAATASAMGKDRRRCVKSASGPLAGRLLPRLVIMHSSAETEPRPPEDTYVQAYRMTQFIGAWGQGPETSPFRNPPEDKGS